MRTIPSAPHAGREDPRFRKLSKLCLGLPEAERALQLEHATFRVRDKVFAYFLNNHHGDGIVSVCVKSALGEGVDRVSREPARFYLPAYIGPRGWFGLRLDRGDIDWVEVANVVELSYRLVAPKKLVKALDAKALGAKPLAARGRSSTPERLD